MACEAPRTGAGDEDDVFFDSREDLSPPHGSASPAAIEVWISDPSTVQERREKFLRSLSAGLASGSGERGLEPEVMSATVGCGAEAVSCIADGERRVTWRGGAESVEDAALVEAFSCVIKNLDDGTVFVVDEIGKDGSLNQLREMGSNKTVTIAEFERHYGSSPFIRRLMRRGVDVLVDCSKNETRGRKTGWLRRLGIKACIIDNQVDRLSSSSGSSDSSRNLDGRGDRVRVRTHKKRSKELSAVYKGQDISAHDGVILTMKFSLDGQYLATGGVDRVVRIWRVVEREWLDVHDSLEDDSSCVYFTVTSNSELTPLHAKGDKDKQIKSSKRNEDSACVVIPLRTFWLSQEPIHEFRGHTADILDISWSPNKQLLSSSMDKTVRLWQVGCSNCLKVFPHKDYVTSVQFKPVDESYFISGSIDGIIRIWDISGCHVVDWADTKEIVTAVCYRPDGKGGVFGTITGNCRFYDASGSNMELESRVCLNGKKKSPLKRITGLQYHPSDPTKLMVTSADAQIRILQGSEVISNYKGLHGSGQATASFTPDGDHIFSAGDDSNIYMWNYVPPATPISTHASAISSYERLSCENACVAIPWNWSATHSRNTISLSCKVPRIPEDFCSTDSNIPENSVQGSTNCNLPSSNFTLSSGFFSTNLPRGTATWPEEKLASSRSSSTLRKSEYKFLKTCCQNTKHAWGHVIVSAGWDGHIRTFYNYGLPIQI